MEQDLKVLASIRRCQVVDMRRVTCVNSAYQATFSPPMTDWEWGKTIRAHTLAHTYRWELCITVHPGMFFKTENKDQGTHCASLCNSIIVLNVLVQKDSNWSMYYPLSVLKSAGEVLCCAVPHPPVSHPPCRVEECESRVHHASLISLGTCSTCRD